MKEKKTRVLMCWGYHRKGWYEPFTKLDDKLEYIYLYYQSSQTDVVGEFPYQRIYWQDFRSAKDLLNKVRPDKIVFMSLDAMQPIALNIAAKKNGITTFVAQHGIYHDYDFYKNLEDQTKQLGGAAFAEQSRDLSTKQSASFLIRSIFPKQVHLMLAIFRFLLAKRKSVQQAHKQCHFSAKEPDYYLALTDFNNRIHYQREGISKNKVIVTGNYYLDDFFENTKAETDGRYYLLIDQAFIESPYFNSGITKEQLDCFYTKLIQFVKSKGSRLVVKLHPDSYKNPPLQDSEYVTVVKDGDMVELIRNASGCFGTISTLLIPALYLKPCCLFEIIKSSTFDTFKESKLAQILPFHSFSAQDISFQAGSPTSPEKKEFSEKFIGIPDGRAIKRFEQAVMSH